MSKYTTGEMAKLTGVSVRTVQYYDNRGLLTPSALTEGGRRLYSEEDLKQMKIICFLKESGLPLNVIDKLLLEEDPGSVIAILLEQQRNALEEELTQQQQKLQRLEELQRELKSVAHFSVKTIGDIAYRMENKKNLRKVHAAMLAIGIPLDLLEIAALIYSINTGNWWVFGIILGIIVVTCIWMVHFYYKRTAYICPQCHEIFKPRKSEFFWAAHTPRTRKLTCPKCGHKGYCVETYAK